jgi:hypothetical protein
MKVLNFSRYFLGWKILNKSHYSLSSMQEVNRQLNRGLVEVVAYWFMMFGRVGNAF